MQNGRVGVNVAADPLFTLTYIGVEGGLLLISADDPGMASSQNEQDNRLYAIAAQMPMFEPSDSQEAYDFTIRALELSEQFHVPAMLRMTTRVCHSRGIVNRWKAKEAPASRNYRRAVRERVMIPAFAKGAHVRLVNNMKALAEWNEKSDLNVAKVVRLVNRDETPEAPPKPGRPPQLCPGCPHRKVFETLRDLGCIVSGDIGCYTLGVLPPFSAIDCCVCMGASIGAGLGLRHGLAEEDARKVVSVIGDSTFVHSGITGIVEMV